jgi:hypothetical protein
MRAIPGKLVDMMLNGRIGVFDTGVSGGEPGLEEPGPVLTVASAIADATGTFVSKKQPAGAHACLVPSLSTIPEPVGSRCTTHHPRARDRITKVSPL